MRTGRHAINSILPIPSPTGQAIAIDEMPGLLIQWPQRQEEALAEEAFFLEYDLPCINMILAEAAELDRDSSDEKLVF